MRNSLLFALFFMVGIFSGHWLSLPLFLQSEETSTYALYVLMFLSGLSIGGDVRFDEILRTIRLRFLWVPITTLVGTFLGMTLFMVIYPDLSWLDGYAIGAGFGYYSLSSILIDEYAGKVTGSIALLSNISREIITLLAAPLLYRYFSKLAPIVSGGATSMDTTLPVITRVVGKHYAFIAVFHGIVLSLLVPVIISILYKFT